MPLNVDILEKVVDYGLVLNEELRQEFSLGNGIRRYISMVEGLLVGILEGWISRP